MRRLGLIAEQTDALLVRKIVWRLRKHDERVAAAKRKEAMQAAALTPGAGVSHAAPGSVPSRLPSAHACASEYSAVGD
jgi:hypothetical protein